mgnify:CR=1 FL=1
MLNLPIAADLGRKIEESSQQFFTGFMTIEASTLERWYLYFRNGEFGWADTQPHCNYRCFRHLAHHAPELVKQLTSKGKLSREGCSYKVLVNLARHKMIGPGQFSEIVQDCISEVLFDILYRGNLSYQASGKSLKIGKVSKDKSESSILSMRSMRPWTQAQADWQGWESFGLISINPDLTPIVLEPKVLQEKVSQATFRLLAEAESGQQSLRDLAFRIKKPIMPLAQSLMPYLEQRLIQLSDTRHLSQQKTQSNRTSPAKVPSPAREKENQTDSSLSSNSCRIDTRERNAKDGSMIVYVDDNPADGKAMGEIIQSFGYGYTNVSDPLQAIIKLLELKPKLVFLDLVMPVVNGYELCAQVRRVSAFRDIPIVIVTNNDGIGDRVRAKIVGASGFLAKPIRSDRVFKVLKNHLIAKGYIPNK